MLCFKFHQNRAIMKNLTFAGLRGLFWGLQKLAQLENMFPNIIEGCFCQKIFVRYLFEVCYMIHYILHSIRRTIDKKSKKMVMDSVLK